MEKELFIQAMIFCISLLLISYSNKRASARYSFMPHSPEDEVLKAKEWYNGHYAANQENIKDTRLPGTAAPTGSHAGKTKHMDSAPASWHGGKLNGWQNAPLHIGVHRDMQGRSCNHLDRCFCLGDTSPPVTG